MPQSTQHVPYWHGYEWAGVAAASVIVTVHSYAGLLSLQEPGRLMSGIYVREPDSPKAPELYVTAAVTEQQYQQVHNPRAAAQLHRRTAICATADAP